MVHTLCQPVAHLGDKPPQIELEWVHATELRNTDKTIMGTAFGGSSKWLVQMVEATDQQTLGGICISSPLAIPADQAQGILDYAESGNPQLNSERTLKRGDRSCQHGRHPGAYKTLRYWAELCSHSWQIRAAG